MDATEHSSTLDSGGSSAMETTPLLSHATDDGSDVCEDTTTSTMFWQEMWTLTRFALPVLGSQLLEFSLIVVEVVSVGHISTSSLAAVSLGAMTANVTGMSMIYGLTSALDTLLPSAYTSAHPELVGLWAQRMGVVVVGALIPIFLLWQNAEAVLLSLKQDPEIARLAALYLHYLCLGLPAAGFNSIARRYFQSQGLFGVQTRIMLIVAPINVLLNYLLVWGPEATRLGFIGAPISTVISFYLVSIISLFYGTYMISHKAWHPISSKMFTNLGILVRLGLSGIGQSATEWWAWELLALAASFLGPIPLAAQSILLTSATTTFQTGYALSNATAIRVGNLLGEKNARRSGVAAKASLLYALIVSTMLSFMYMIFRKSWAHMFNSDPEVVAIVSSVLPVLALFQIVDSNSSVTGAVLRTRGKQFIGALLNISAYYVVGLPLGIWLAFRWNMGLTGLWIGITVALLYCSVVGTILCFRTDWNFEVIKVQDRIAQEARLRKLVDEEESSSVTTS
ncbi:mate-domain-containing protein [Lyophyllum atratum]|nr:mate-domain-containing protein [Lyophyllum atratum]